jgi:hypothetical protein
LEKNESKIVDFLLKIEEKTILVGIVLQCVIMMLQACMHMKNWVWMYGHGCCYNVVSKRLPKEAPPEAK